MDAKGFVIPIEFQYAGAALEDLGHVSHREQSADRLAHLSAPAVDV